MSNQIILNRILNSGISFDEYFKLSVIRVNNDNSQELNDEEKALLEYARLNIKRTERILKTYTASQKLESAIATVTKPQVWMVITEDWCGDSAQNLPYIVKIAQLNSLINLKILYRDKNLEIIDQYHTNGTRSIPILVAFNETGDELFKWGPRPKDAAELVKNAKAQGKSKDQFIEELHLWYSRDKGRTLENEIIGLLSDSK